MMFHFYRNIFKPYGLKNDMFKTIKSNIAGLIRNIIESAATFGTPAHIPKTLMILKLDAIGDYVVFRNFIEILKNEPKYSEYRFTLCASASVKTLAEETEKNYIDEFIWIDTRRFYTNYLYRFQVLRLINRKGFEIVIHPTYSREHISDKLVYASNAVVRVGNSGNGSNISNSEKKQFDSYYTTLIDTETDEKILKFEFFRYKKFFEILLNKKINLNKPFINLVDTNTSHFHDMLSRPYAVIFPGATSPRRRWAPSGFAEICDWLSSHYNLNIVMAGSQQDIDIASEIIRKASTKKIINLTGKTKLSELALLLLKAEMLVSNDTSAVHIAAAVNTKNILCISNGNHFKRFIPYPAEVCENFCYICPDELEKNINNNEYLKQKYLFGSDLDINEITSIKVKNIIDKIFSGKND